MLGRVAFVQTTVTRVSVYKCIVKSWLKKDGACVRRQNLELQRKSSLLMQIADSGIHVYVTSNQTAFGFLSILS